ncbi:MAG: hypothetical protein WAZ40_00215 [Minisyncoccia bacterium]
MQKEQKKAVLVNILTFVVVAGLLFTGYIVFLKPAETLTDGQQVVSVAQTAEDAAAIGNQIKNTKRELSDLERAVASSSVVFSKPAFKNLQDFTVIVSSEPVGRDNPFTPALWKIKQTLETAGGKTSPAPVLPGTGGANTSTQTSSSASLLGNFGGGAL